MTACGCLPTKMWTVVGRFVSQVWPKHGVGDAPLHVFAFASAAMVCKSVDICFVAEPIPPTSVFNTILSLENARDMNKGKFCGVIFIISLHVITRSGFIPVG